MGFPIMETCSNPECQRTTLSTPDGRWFNIAALDCFENKDKLQGSKTELWACSREHEEAALRHIMRDMPFFTGKLREDLPPVGRDEDEEARSRMARVRGLFRSNAIVVETELETLESEYPADLFNSHLAASPSVLAQRPWSQRPWAPGAVSRARQERLQAQRLREEMD